MQDHTSGQTAGCELLVFFLFDLFLFLSIFLHLISLWLRASISFLDINLRFSINFHRQQNAICYFPSCIHLILIVLYLAVVLDVFLLICLSHFRGMSRRNRTRLSNSSPLLRRTSGGPLIKSFSGR